MALRITIVEEDRRIDGWLKEKAAMQMIDEARGH